MSQTSGATKGASWTFAIILIVIQGVGSLMIGMMSMFFMMISDGCHNQPDDPFICSDSGGLFFFGGLFLEWALLGAGFILSIVLLAKTNKSPIVQVLKGCGVGLLGIVVIIVTVAVSAS